MSIQIEESWKNVLGEEFEKPYFAELKTFLQAEKKAGKTIFPPGKMIFNAFDSTPFNDVKVVIIGQDPYHGPGQAHGLCFSVQKGVVTPPSLRNMYKELKDDLDLPIPSHGNLQHWADQGVLLLNAILTVQAHEAASHRKKGWETFTDAAIRALNAQRENIVFLLWGSFAKSKANMIDISKHHILHTVHPSPLSAHRGFMGCKHFSKTNEILQAHNIAPVDWTVR